MHYAINKQLLIQYEADINDNRSSESLLHYAAPLKNSFKIIKTLIDHGADVNLIIKRDPEVPTPLHNALKHYDEKEVQLLIEKNTVLKIKKIKGQNFLHFATADNCNIIAKIFLGHGIKINVQDRDGLTALYHAVMNSRTKNLHLNVLQNSIFGLESTIVSLAL